MTDQPSEPVGTSSRIALGSVTNALFFYRLMAFITGTVLLLGTIGLLAQAYNSTMIFGGMTTGLWMAHGYLFMIYALATLNLGIHLRWHPLRLGATMAAGTIPTMSFVAERLITRQLRRRPAQVTER